MDTNTPQPIPANVEKLMDDLQSGLDFVRRNAARELGQLTASNENIVVELMAARKDERSPEVRKATDEALQAPAHQAVIQQCADLDSKAAALATARRRQRLQANAQEQAVEENRQNGQRELVVGTLLLLGGLAVTFYTWATTESGGTYIIAWGAILLGAVALASGFTKSHQTLGKLDVGMQKWSQGKWGWRIRAILLIAALLCGLPLLVYAFGVEYLGW